jgi:hypothetical protein
MEEKTKKQEKPPEAIGPPPVVSSDEARRVGDESRRVGLEQVREILFGAAHRDFEQRLGKFSAQISGRYHDLEQEHRRRTEVFEAHLKKETDALATRVERQHTEAIESLRGLSREGREANAQLERRITKLEEASADGLRELRHQLLEQANSFLDELKNLRREMLATIENELGPAEDAEAHDEAERRH